MFVGIRHVVKRAFMRRAWPAQNCGQGVWRSNFEDIGGRAPARVQKHGILATERHAASIKISEGPVANADELDDSGTIRGRR